MNLVTLAVLNQQKWAAERAGLKTERGYDTERKLWWLRIDLGGGVFSNLEAVLTIEDWIMATDGPRE